MPGPETRARRKIVQALKNRNFVVFTIHGGAFSAGTPDLLGGIPGTGRLLGIEMKARRLKDLRKAKEPLAQMSNSRNKAEPMSKSGPKLKQGQSVDLSDDRLSRLARRGYPPVPGEDVGSMREAARGRGAVDETKAASSEMVEAPSDTKGVQGATKRAHGETGGPRDARRASSEGPKPAPTALQLEALKDIDEAGGLALVVVYEIDEGRRTRFRIWKLDSGRFSLYMTVRKAEDVADLIPQIPS